MFKSTFALIDLLVFAASIVAQDEEGYTKEDLRNKARHFKNMRTTGFVFLGIGVITLVSGISLVSNATWESQSTSTGSEVTTHDANGGAGIICIAIGAPAAIAGAVLSILGNGKYHEYKNRATIYGGYEPTRKIYCSRLVIAL